MREILRAAFVIGRRDYRATVMSKTFLFFLLGPLFPIGLGIIFGALGSDLARQDNERIVAFVANETDYDALQTARQRLDPLTPSDRRLLLERVDPATDPDAQREALLARTDRPVVGVLEGGLDAPVFTSTAGNRGYIGQLDIFLDAARRDAAMGAPPGGSPIELRLIDTSVAQTTNARSVTARAGQAILFFLTILLAGMLLSQMLEEKSNKAIEVLASAVPVDSIFVGKLFAMLAISLTGISVWLGTAILAIAAFAPPGLAALIPAPALGWPAFLFLALLYFAMSYLLIGAAFLGIGAQASTVREVQTLSMPITMLQVGLFFAAQLGVGEPGGREAILAAIFPLTSPFAMIARAAEEPVIWTHAAAILWQALWVALILRFASSLFRKSVLKSGKHIR